MLQDATLRNTMQQYAIIQTSNSIESSKSTNEAKQTQETHRVCVYMHHVPRRKCYFVILISAFQFLWDVTLL